MPVLLWEWAVLFPLELTLSILPSGPVNISIMEGTIIMIYLETT